MVPGAEVWDVRDRSDAPRVGIEPWREEDLDLLHRMNTPGMTEHLGGVESEERLLARHRLFLRINREGLGRRFAVVLLPERQVVGSIGYSEREWQGRTVYEMGWKVLPAFQGRGVATAAGAAAVAHARREGRPLALHAFPSVDNTASNLLCRRLGFSLVGPCTFEFPAGTFKPSNDWRLDPADAAARPPGSRPSLVGP
jgi:RimJ/RimL family protein N-acetyltransferase